MNNQECLRIRDQLQYGFAGPAWHGPSIKKVLADLEASQMLNATSNSHNIAELIEHMTAWRNYAIKKLEGDESYEVSDEENFPPVKENTLVCWQSILGRLKASQTRLVELLESISDDKLLETVPGRKYDFYILLHGIVQHDLYHLGQIILLKKLSKE